MMKKQLRNLALVALTVGLFNPPHTAVGNDYVWARTNWGSSNINRPYSSMNNGYGGYYVPRNARGNNFEGQRRFTNPTGFIVPAQPVYRSR